MSEKSTEVQPSVQAFHPVNTPIVSSPSLDVMSSLENLNVPQKYIRHIYDATKKYTEYDLIAERTKAQEQAMVDIKAARAVIEKHFEKIEEELVSNCYSFNCRKKKMNRLKRYRIL